MLESLAVLAGLLALRQGASASELPPFFPIHYGPGEYPRVMTDIYFGTPRQKPAIPTIVDLGSANYWVYGPNAIVNYGSQYLGGQGPCNITAMPFYNNTASTTATKPTKHQFTYAYGGNGKIVAAYYSTNDTLHFGQADVPVLTNQRVAVSNYTLVKQLANKHCKGSKNFEYDRSILGISKFVAGKHTTEVDTDGPSFRQDLLDQGKIKSSSMSMWFDKGPVAANGTFHGTVLLGAVPSGKYSGQLTKIKLHPPKDAYVGYYTPKPVFSATNAKTKKTITMKSGTYAKNCLVDSGSGIESLPIDEKELLEAAGLVKYKGYPAYNGSCDSIPKNAALHFKFPGATAGKSITISVPLKNYAVALASSSSKHCQLSIEADKRSPCLLAAGSVTGMFIAVNDGAGEFALAQGLVGKGAQKGPRALGKVQVIHGKQSIPGAV